MADIDGVIRTLRILTVANLGSLAAFGAVAAAFRTQLAPGFSGDVRNGLVVAAGLVALTCAAGYLAVYRQSRAGLQAGARARRSSAEPLAAVLEPYRRLVVLRAALIEAPALVGLLAYLVGGGEAGLLIAVASAVLLVGTMPSRAGLQRFAEGLGE